jgi:hypothetical protein
LYLSLRQAKRKNMKNFELHITEIKGDTVVMYFSDETGSVSLQVSKETLMTHICDEQLNVDTINDYVLDAETYLMENLTDVAQSYLEEL